MVTEQFYEALVQSIDFNNDRYSVVVKQNNQYSCSIAPFSADVSIELTRRREQFPFYYILFVDAEKVFERGTIDDAILSFSYRYGTPDKPRTFIFFVANGGFSSHSIEVCRKYKWMALLRLADGNTRAILNRAYLTPTAYNTNQNDFISGIVRESLIFVENNFRPFRSFLEEQGIILKNDLRIQPDYLTKEQISQQVEQLRTNAVPYNSDDNILETIATYLQVQVVHLKMNSEQLGYYSLADNTIYINTEENCTQHFRSRFTLAHELGHRFLHKALLEKYDKDCVGNDTWGTICNAFTMDETKWFEWQANQFASCILLPKEKVTRTFFRCAAELYEMGVWAENMRRIIQLRYLWVNPDDKLSDNRNAAHRLLAKLSDTMSVSKEALQYRLIDLGLVHTPEKKSIKTRDIILWMTE